MANAPAVRDEFFEALLGDFLDESGQLLDRLNTNLLHLDEWVRQLGEEHRESCDPEMLNEMFRAAHSLKGLSAMLGLGDINTLTHKIENVFDAARKDELVVNGGVVELMFQAVDRLGGMVHALKDAEASPLDAADVVDDIQCLLRAAGCERKTTTQADAERALAAEMAAAEAAVAPSPPPQSVVVDADHFVGLSDDVDHTSKYLPIFIDEADQSLDELTEALLATERGGQGNAVERLMVTAHRIKGAAASVGLNRAAKLAHLMEDGMQELLETHRPLTPRLADALLRCADELRQFVAGLRQGEGNSAGFNQRAKELLEAMQLGRAADAAAAPATVAAEPQAASDDQWLTHVRQMAKDPEHTLVGHIAFQADLALVGLKARLVHEKLSGLGELLAFEPALEKLDELETIPTASFALATELTAAEVRRKASVAGIVDFAVAALVEPTVVAAVTEVQPQKPDATTATPPAAIEATPGPTSKARAADANKPNETLRVDIERLDQLMNLTGQLVINKARFAKIGEQLRAVTLTKRRDQALASVSSVLDRLADNRLETADLQALAAMARRAKQELEGVRQEIDVFARVRPTINNLFETIHQLDRVTDALQQSVMDTRMLPIGPLFTRFKRVVRDISRSNGKQINLVINGEKTELDKRMIDELGDPLIHMVRNSADHGIESPEVRTAAGKPAQGTITLDAFHRGNTIVIQVSDDGKGLDADRIRDKAIERGLISAADAEKMTRRQIYQLIWEPGLSTADKVTDISGRGMGMDIVRSKIEELNGAIELDSEPGRGTQVTIKLPLTLAILPSLMVEIGGAVYAMPVEGVQEIVQVTRKELFTVHQQRVAQVRGRVISTTSLGEVFTWADNGPVAAENDEVVLVVVGQRGCEIGLAVDRVVGEEDIVIKSMAENYRNVPGVAGASILGDGRVSLILDLAALIDMASRRSSAAVV